MSTSPFTRIGPTVEPWKVSPGWLSFDPSALAVRMVMLVPAGTIGGGGGGGGGAAAVMAEDGAGAIVEDGAMVDEGAIVEDGAGADWAAAGWSAAGAPFSAAGFDLHPASARLNNNALSAKLFLIGYFGSFRVKRGSLGRDRFVCNFTSKRAIRQDVPIRVFLQRKRRFDLSRPTRFRVYSRRSASCAAS
jgi:hypothetical protein